MMACSRDGVSPRSICSRGAGATPLADGAAFAVIAVGKTGDSADDTGDCMAFLVSAIILSDWCGQGLFGPGKRQRRLVDEPAHSQDDALAAAGCKSHQHMRAVCGPRLARHSDLLEFMLRVAARLHQHAASFHRIR